ncbi:hypothetical protein ACFPMF_27635 [Larkinella bovis]|uniref:Replication initiation protein n=1 Tax=Larkinella bovis TaxID=683041 RepID=A0ABW0IIM7_9BACT
MDTSLAILIPNQGASLLRWHILSNQLNEAVPWRTYTATRRGEKVEVPHRPKAITGNVKATGARLIKDQISTINQLARALGEAAFYNEEGDISIPPLLTNSVKLGARRGLSDRQARAHVRKLQKVGLVKRYQWRGTRADFKIWIDEKVLFAHHSPAQALLRATVDNPVESSKKPLSKLQIGQIIKASTEDFSAYKVTVTHSNNETETDKCRNVEHGDDQKAVALVEHGDEFHGNPERQPEKPAQTEPAKAPETPQGYHERGGGGPAATTAGERLKANLMVPKRPRPIVRRERTDEQKKAMMEGYVTSFWLYARQILYPSRTFQEYENRTVINAIRAGVYRDFSYQLTEKQWDQFQAQLYRRVDLAAGFYSRHPDKWVPDPYARFREGTGYFDWENLRGFRATDAWLQDNQRKYRRNYTMGRISWAIIQLRRHPEGKAQKRLQEKTYIDAYRTLEQMMINYGEAAVDRFRELASTIGQQKPQSAGGQRRFNR